METKNTLLTGLRKRRTASPRRQGGFNLIELGLVLALIGLASAGIYVYYTTNKNSSDVQAEAKNVMTIATKVREMANGRQSYAGFTEASVIPVLPVSMVSGSSVVNRWTGAVTVAADSAATPTNSRFSITYASVPKSSCAGLISQVASNFEDIKIGTTSLFTSGAIDQAKIDGTSGCGGTGPFSVVFFTR